MTYGGPDLALPADHPGVGDPEYRRRRAEIARAGGAWMPGDALPADRVHRGRARRVAPGDRRAPEPPRHLCLDGVPLGRGRAGPPDRPRATARRAGPPPLRAERLPRRPGPRARAGPHLLRQPRRLDVHVDAVPAAHVGALLHAGAGRAPRGRRAPQPHRQPRFRDPPSPRRRGSRRCETDAAHEFFSRVFWFTLEFGVVHEDGEMRAYGAGLASSFGEIQAFRRAEIRPFDLTAMGTTDYDITRYQPVLFSVPSIPALVDDLGEFFATFDDEMHARLTTGVD